MYVVRHGGLEWTDGGVWCVCRQIVGYFTTACVFKRATQDLALVSELPNVFRIVFRELLVLAVPIAKRKISFSPEDQTQPVHVSGSARRKRTHTSCHLTNPPSRT